MQAAHDCDERILIYCGVVDPIKKPLTLKIGHSLAFDIRHFDPSPGADPVKNS
jgi:hypothetical protein